jgi:hypothetical protein
LCGRERDRLTEVADVIFPGFKQGGRRRDELIRSDGAVAGWYRRKRGCGQAASRGGQGQCRSRCARASTSCNLSSTDKEPQLTKGFCEQPVYRMDSVCPHLPVSFLSRHPYHDTWKPDRDIFLCRNLPQFFRQQWTSVFNGWVGLNFN